MSQPAHSPNRLTRLLTALALTALLGLALAFATGFLHAPAAYAQGTAAITADEELPVVFRAAASDDPGRTPDPGSGEHIGRCTARLLDRRAVSIRLYNGYPGYRCTITLQLENRGAQAVRLRDIRYKAPDGLLLHGPQADGQTVLAPGQSLEQVFVLAVTAAARESARYQLAIQEIFSLDRPQNTLINEENGK